MDAVEPYRPVSACAHTFTLSANTRVLTFFLLPGQELMLFYHIRSKQKKQKNKQHVKRAAYF